MLTGGRKMVAAEPESYDCAFDLRKRDLPMLSLLLSLFGTLLFVYQLQGPLGDLWFFFVE